MAKKTTSKKTEVKVFESENVKIQFRPYENKSTLGFATVTLYDCITIYQCVVMKKKNGDCFVAMPTYKAKDDNYYNYVYLDKDDELTEELNNLINTGISSL